MVTRMKDKIVVTGIFTYIAWPTANHGMFLEVPTINLSIILNSVEDMKMWGSPSMMMGENVKITIEKVKS